MRGETELSFAWEIIAEMSTRRDFFRQAAVLAGSAGSVSTLLASIERAAEIDPPEGSSFLDAEHVVILMQENRSFDHAFGTLRGVRGFNDPRAVTLPDQKPVWMQTNKAGETYAPFRLDFKGSKATWLGSLPHSWRDQTDARNHGNHDGWLDAKGSNRKECAGMPLTMGYYDREDLPFYYALADAFTICDQHFCSSLTGTTPNRLHLWTGTIREKPDAASAPNVRNADVNYGSNASWKTFPERLEEAGVSWRVYQNELSVASGLEGEEDAWLANFTDNPLEWFDQYHVGFRKTHLEYVERMAATLPAEIAKMRREGAPEKELAKKEQLLRYVTAERAQWTAEARARLSARDLSLHDKAFTTNEDDPGYRQLSTLHYRDGGAEQEMAIPKSDPLRRFRRDVESGKLPAVSWLVPSERFSRSSRFPVVWRLVRRRDVEYPYEESGGLEEDDLHSDLRRKRRILRPRSAVRGAGSSESGVGQDVAGHRREPGVSAARAGLEAASGEGGARRSGGPGLIVCRWWSHRRGAAAGMSVRRFSTIRRCFSYWNAWRAGARRKKSGRRTSGRGGGRCAAI